MVCIVGPQASGKHTLCGWEWDSCASAHSRCICPSASLRCRGGRGGVWHKASVSDCLPLAAPIGLWPLLILTLRGPERVVVVSTEPPDDLSCLTTPGVGRPGDGAVARAVDQGVGGGGPRNFVLLRIIACSCRWGTARECSGSIRSHAKTDHAVSRSVPDCSGTVAHAG